MWVVVDVSWTDNVDEVYGPFETEDLAEEWRVVYQEYMDQPWVIEVKAEVDPERRKVV